MTIKQAENVSELLWEIRRTEGNISNLERYLAYRQSDDVKFNKHADVVEVRIRSYAQGHFEFIIDESLCMSNATLMLKDQKMHLQMLKEKLDNCEFRPFKM